MKAAQGCRRRHFVLVVTRKNCSRSSDPRSRPGLPRLHSSVKRAADGMAAEVSALMGTVRLSLPRTGHTYAQRPRRRRGFAPGGPPADTIIDEVRLASVEACSRGSRCTAGKQKPAGPRRSRIHDRLEIHVRVNRPRTGTEAIIGPAVDETEHPDRTISSAILQETRAWKVERRSHGDRER